MSKNGLYLSEENKGGYGNPNGLYLTEQSTSSNNGAVRIGGSLYSKNWDNSYKGMHVPNGHGSLFNAMDQDARIIAQCEANKLLWIAEANKQKALENGANLNAPIVPPPPVLNNPVPNNPPLTELEIALVEIKALKEANAAKDLKIANMVSKEEVEQIIEANKEEIEKVTKDNAEKDSVIAEQGKTIDAQSKEKENVQEKLNDALENNREAKETIKDLRNDKAGLNKQVDKLEKEISNLKLLEKDFFDLKLSLKDAEVKKSKIKQSEKYMSNDDSEQSSWSYCGKKDLKSVSSSSSKSSIYKAKIKQLEEQNTIFKNMYIQNPKIDLIKSLSHFPENKFPTEEMQKDLSGENIDFD